MKNTAYNFFQDPGHGWLAVPFKDLDELGIRQLISSYSYFKGNTVYLEEDCDASVFFKAYEAKFGKKPEYVSKYHDNNSPIRSYACFQVAEDYDREAYIKYLYGEPALV